MRWKSVTAAALLVFLPSASIAQQSCISREDAEILVTALQPSIIESVRDRCSAHLPPGSALVERGATMVGRYAQAADDVRPQAVSIATSAAMGDEAEILPDWFRTDAILDVFETALAVAVTQDLNAQNCAVADDLFAALEPLPAANFASILTTLWEAGANSDDAEPGDSPIRICPRT